MTAMEKKLDKAIQKNKEAKGLAIIIHNGYANDDAQDEKCDTLEFTAKDGKAMLETFTSLGFATVEMRDVITFEIEGMIEALAKSKLPDGYRRIVIYFSGHGNEGSKLYDNKGGEFDYEEIIVQRLKDTAKSVPILMFVDACRGELSPLVGKLKNKAPDNIMVACASPEKFQSLGLETGSIWTQILAPALMSPKRVKDILADVKAEMPSDYKKEALPVVNNPEAGNIFLIEQPGAKSGNDLDAPKKQAQQALGGEGYKIDAQVVNIVHGGVGEVTGGFGNFGAHGGPGAGTQPQPPQPPQLPRPDRPTMEYLADSGILNNAQGMWREIGALLGQSNQLDGYAAIEMNKQYGIITRIFQAWRNNDGTATYPLSWNGLGRILRHETVGLGIIPRDLGF